MTDEDKEIAAITQISKVLSGLEKDEIDRVLRWAADKYGASFVGQRVLGPGQTDQEKIVESEGNGGKPYENFAEFYNAINPSTEPERMLVAGYWFQVIDGSQTLTSLQINSALKNLGHGISNAARAMGVLIDQKPRLVMQIKKKGPNRQGRKEFKLTMEGTKKVESMKR